LFIIPLKNWEKNVIGIPENLILVNAFYTNSILLKGLIDYLKKYFNVYFIDLPGFAKDAPPLKEISINLYFQNGPFYYYNE